MARTRGGRAATSIPEPNPHEQAENGIEMLINLMTEQRDQIHNLQHTVNDLSNRQGQLENIMENPERNEEHHHHRAEQEIPPFTTVSPKQNTRDRTNKSGLVFDPSKDIQKIAPPKFDGKHVGDAAEDWLTEMEKYFELKDYPASMKAIWGAYQLTGEAASWWTNIKEQFNYTKATLS